MIVCEKQAWQSTGEAMKPRSPLDEPTITQTIQGVDSIPIESIYGIGKRYSEALRGIGVETVGEVDRIRDIDELEELLGIPAKVLHRIRLRALSYAGGEVLQAESFEFPGERLIYIDIETDPACSRVWLIGLLLWKLFGGTFASNELRGITRFLPNPPLNLHFNGKTRQIPASHA
jgi:hypothetical protein